ncbi:MAG: VCBS repeat-containing protein [Mariprofundus sp.]|nr:VCBS repeat-containing protein [Mariprofundus sp.]
MKTSMHSERNSRSEQCLSARIQARHDLNDLCAVAVQQQIERGDVDATHLRNRRRYLARQILKRIPHAGIMSPRKLIHAAAMVLAMWGFAGVSMPMQAEAAPLFKHVILDGFDVGSIARPSFADIDGDGDLDAFVGESGGTVKFYRNDDASGNGTAPTFVAIAGAGNPLNGFNVGSFATPSFADIDGDGDLDAFVGENGGTVRFYRNNGSNTAPNFVADAANNPLAAIAVGRHAAPSFADIDGDGDLDAFVGELLGTVKFYRNDDASGNGTAPTFVAVAGAGNPLNGFDVGVVAAPSFADIDGDGDLDAFVGELSGTMKFYRNDDASGNGTAPTFVAVAGAGNPLNGFGVGVNAAPSFADIDGDGDLDAFVGEGHGTVQFFENFDIQKLPLATGAGNLFISTNTGAIPSASLTSAVLVNPPAGNFPFGKISYNIITTAGGTVVVRVVFPSALPTGFQVFKIDAADNFTVIPASQYTQVNPTTIDLTLTDGGAFDLDGNATNGVIVDPITLGVPAATSTVIPPRGGGGCAIQPTTNFDPMLPLLALMATFSAWLRRKRC